MITNKESLESFINFCNDMEIAEEGKIIEKNKKKVLISDTKKRREEHSTPVNKELLERKRKREEQTRKINSIIKAINVKETPLPNNFDINNENIVRKYCELARKDTINYIKKYISHPLFKSKYSQYLPLINIIPVNYADEFDIEVTNYQSGYDYDRAEKYSKEHPGASYKDNPWYNTDWYYELLEAGVMIADKVFDHTVIRSITTGDEDEGCIYIRTILD